MHNRALSAFTRAINRSWMWWVARRHARGCETCAQLFQVSQEDSRVYAAAVAAAEHRTAQVCAERDQAKASAANAWATVGRMSHDIDYLTQQLNDAVSERDAARWQLKQERTDTMRRATLAAQATGTAQRTIEQGRTQPAGELL